MEKFKTPQEVMEKWEGGIPFLVRCIRIYGLPIYDPYNEKRLELKKRMAFPGAEGTIYVSVHPRSVLDSSLVELEYALSLDYCVFKLSELEAFAKKHDLSSFCEPEPQDQERTRPPSAAGDPKQEMTDDYIKAQLAKGTDKHIIAFELHNERGNFRLTYLEITRALGLDEGLHRDQIDALKQRARRACNHGEKLLREQKAST